MREEAGDGGRHAPQREGRVNSRGTSFFAELQTLFPIIIDRLRSGRARSAHQAATQLVAGHKVPGGTPFNKAHRLGKLYRDALKLSAFQKSKNELTNPMLAYSKDK